jgi:hypothetical protein
MYSEVINTSWTSTLHGNFRWLAPELLGDPGDDLPVRPTKYSDTYSFGGIMLQVCPMNFILCNEIVTFAPRSLRARSPIFT